MPSSIPSPSIILGQTLSVNWILATSGCDILISWQHLLVLQTYRLGPISHPEPVLTEPGETLNSDPRPEVWKFNCGCWVFSMPYKHHLLPLRSKCLSSGWESHGCLSGPCHSTTPEIGPGHVILLLPNFLLLGLQPVIQRLSSPPCDQSHTQNSVHSVHLARAWTPPGTCQLSTPGTGALPKHSLLAGTLQHMDTTPRIVTATCLAPKGSPTAVPCPTRLDLVPKIA